MPVSSLRGVGRQTRKIFDRLGIRTVAQLRSIPLRYLEEPLGKKAAASYHAQARGIASAAVTPGQGRKSISKETTFEEDVQDQGFLHDVLCRLAGEVASTARREGLSGSVVTLKIRFTGFETHTRQHRLDNPTHDERVILREAWSLFLHGDLGNCVLRCSTSCFPAVVPHRPVRLIGVGISDWQEAESEPVQADLFDQPQKRKQDERLLETLDKVADRFGKGVLQLGCVSKAGRHGSR